MTYQLAGVDKVDSRQAEGFSHRKHQKQQIKQDGGAQKCGCGLVKI